MLSKIALGNPLPALPAHNALGHQKEKQANIKNGDIDIKRLLQCALYIQQPKEATSLSSSATIVEQP